MDDCGELGMFLFYRWTKIDVRSQSNPDEVQEGGIAQAPAEVAEGAPTEETNKEKN
jgi:hypothetical protein